MDVDKLNKWADLLLDTGKRNNLINFKDTKMGTVEVVSPGFDNLFSKAEHSARFEVYDPELYDEEDDEIEETVEEDESLKDEQEEFGEKRISKEDYIEEYGKRLKKNSQILIYNAFSDPIKALSNIAKKSKTAMEETGVNISYMAFGFVRWTEDEKSQYVMRAPILLVPVSIENSSAVDPYYVRIMDSDIIVNPTFLFKLKNDYGIELPAYDDEDIETYLEKVQKCVSKLKWSVTRECKIGVFSFLKINMYKDLKDNADKILENENVQYLLGEKEIKPDTGDNETKNSPVQLHNVVDADSSQAEAIEMAHNGKSFVLQGPPGTGKSQTITNIIAECLANNKKVLFVSEKLAALNVVHDKLNKAGLEEFCLELHSHKANKKDVITELCRTLKLSKSNLSGNAQKEIEAKILAQKELDEYAEELHKTRPVINKTLYKLFEEVSFCRKAPDIEFVIKGIGTKGEGFIEKAENILTQYVGYSSSIGYDYHQNVWYGYTDPDYSYQSKIQLKSDLKDVIAFCKEINELNDNIKERYSVSAKNVTQAYGLRDFFNLVKNSKFVTPTLLNFPVLENVINIITSMRALSKEILNDKKIIEDIFDEDIYKVDGQAVYKKLTKQYNGFFARLFSGEYRRIAKDFKLCSKDGKKIKYDVAVSMTNVLRVYQQRVEEFNNLEKNIKTQIGSEYCGVTTKFDDLLAELETLTEILSDDIDFTKLSTLSYQNFIAEQKEFSTISDCINGIFGRYENAEKRVSDKYDFSEYNVREEKIDALINKYQGCVDNIDKLDNWCEFVKLLNLLDEMELKSFVDSAIERKLKTQDIVCAYKKAFYTQWIDIILRESPILVKLSRIPHDELVKLFQTKDELNFEINKADIKSRLSSQRPDLNMVARGSAISILLRENEKKRKQKGIRVLLDEIGDLVQTIKPCFLMSPLSVSTFLSPDILFDVVIFDEASQIFPQDAIGAIYRGKQLIVVGDSKQMPPSNFFNTSNIQESTDSEEDDVTDFESILDICSTVLPQKRLKWHYRSRFESLISFSNKNFYDNDLVTFPSSRKDVKGIGVDYFYVNGVFDRRSKTNRREAEKVVDLVFENIEKYPERSLGVVAFSMSQQNLIDKLIAKRRQQDPSKEPFFKSDNAEPFFVKNLETVQGDERDTIIFSIAYGKDSQGRLLLNFGPVNREGGERRLNVAVTRAKYNVQLVSSMRHTDIDLSRTQSVGARKLKEYLDYAENGESALARSVSVNPFEQYDSEFEMEVCEFLREKGFSVDTQVGCSSFKIDLALKRPDSSDYVLAIECDGATYHSSKSTRDRDRLRQEILEGMGWKFYRIWSTDWFRNKREEKERLLNVANSAIKNAGEKVAKEVPPLKSVSFEEITKVKPFEFPKYVMADEDKLSEKNGYKKLDIICDIVESESPVSEEWLMKRIVFLFGREKVTNVVRDEFNYILRNCSKYKIVRKKGFLYSQGKEIPMLRVPQGNTPIREIKYISLEELSLGMKEVIKQNISIEKNSLFRYIYQQLGFSRMGKDNIERLEKALRLLSDDIEINGDMVSIKQ